MCVLGMCFGGLRDEPGAGPAGTPGGGRSTATDQFPALGHAALPVGVEYPAHRPRLSREEWGQQAEGSAG
jgi:hypothetical protein